MFIQNHLRCGALDGFMRLLSALGDVGMIWIALALAFLCFRRERRDKVLLIMALLMSLMITNIALKNIIHRIRPYDFMASLNILVNPERDFSFPSGHASSSFAAAWALWRTGPKKWGAAALCLAGLIALSRLYVGVHYPTDVLAGILVGILCGETAHRLAQRIPVRELK